MVRPPQLDGSHAETVKDLIRRLIPRMVADFLAQPEARKSLETNGIGDMMIEGVANEFAVKLPQGDTPKMNPDNHDDSIKLSHDQLHDGEEGIAR